MDLLCELVSVLACLFRFYVGRGWAAAVLSWIIVSNWLSLRIYVCVQLYMHGKNERLKGLTVNMLEIEHATGFATNTSNNFLQAGSSARLFS